MLGLAAGTLLGLAHFGSLRRNARLYAGGGTVAGALLLQLGRFALLAGGLTLLARLGALPLLSGALGLLVARSAILRRAGGVR